MRILSKNKDHRKRLSLEISFHNEYFCGIDDIWIYNLRFEHWLETSNDGTCNIYVTYCIFEWKQMSCSQRDPLCRIRKYFGMEWLLQMFVFCYDNRLLFQLDDKKRTPADKTLEFRLCRLQLFGMETILTFFQSWEMCHPLQFIYSSDI